MAKVALGGEEQKDTEERKEGSSLYRDAPKHRPAQGGEQEIPGKGKAVGKITGARRDSVKILGAPPGSPLSPACLPKPTPLQFKRLP